MSLKWGAASMAVLEATDGLFGLKNLSPISKALTQTVLFSNTIFTQASTLNQESMFNL